MGRPQRWPKLWETEKVNIEVDETKSDRELVDPRL